MDQELLDKLSSCRDLPSLPAAAVRIVELAREPDTTMAQVASAVGLDPAVSAKLLRVANSPLHGGRRRSTNLRQAVTLLGLNATLTIALSFAVFPSLRDGRQGRLNRDMFWCRSLLAAAAGRALASHAPGAAPDDTFLAALVQDIGVLAVEAVAPDLYAKFDNARQLDHAYLCAYEHAALGTDHAEIGAWLLDQWAFPYHLAQAVACSHELTDLVDGSATTPISRCVALSGLLADGLLQDDPAPLLQQVLGHARSYWSVDDGWINTVMETLASEVPEVESLFSVSLLDDTQVRALQADAREALVVQVEEMHTTADTMRRESMEMEERRRRDDLTGVFNRGYLDHALEQELQQALANGWPCSVIFADLDHFKRMNDSFGHAAGDAALKQVAQVLARSIRSSDFLCRYGGEEFVVVLPGTDAAGARIAAQRILEAVRRLEPTTDARQTLGLTVSLGVATHCGRTPLPAADELLCAADRAMYLAKQSGRDCLVVYGEEGSSR